MITTIPEYCKQRNVTRQFVYEYIKKGKFKHYEMPVFVESNGDKIMLGNQKVLEVPDEFAPKKSDALTITEESLGNPESLINSVTDDPTLRNLYRDLIGKMPDVDKLTAKNIFNAAIEQHPEKDCLKVEIDEANIRLMQHMVKMEAFMRGVVKDAHEAAKSRHAVERV
jgi:hypothetical protein